ncbi:hypothetical protein RN001_003873 [Aquatica leii]|uniref:Uncharacterized protein n=1 Tax=Aquatica leii TaxID=1421715 RepID=A0AAN7Q9Y5_9COLE|nr:hypothetical protein RN001_003873 [Aquatica leii]
MLVWGRVSIFITETVHQIHVVIFIACKSHYEEESVEEEDDFNVEVKADTGPSASAAFVFFETVLKWIERQPDCDHMQLLTVKRMRDLAFQKRIKTDYFGQNVQQTMTFALPFHLIN